jgi:hypothetical protein
MTAHDGTANQLPKLVIRLNGPDNLRTYCGVDNDEAIGNQIGIHRTQVFRVLSGHHSPGNRFIAGVIDRCGLDFAFDKVFRVVDK